MPHKHKRQRLGGDEGFNLPPAAFAKPLAVGKKGMANTSHGARGKGKRTAPMDDTPRAFKHLMRLQHTGKGLNGLDNGDRIGKKRKRSEVKNVADGGNAATTTGSKSRPANENTNKKNSNDKKTSIKSEDETTFAISIAPAVQPPPTSLPTPLIAAESLIPLKIQPGERFADFSARVNHALPLSGLTKKAKATVIDGKEVRDTRRTKHEKRLRKLQDGWRTEEARIREKEDEERELEEEREDEEKALYGEDFGRGRNSMAAAAAVGGVEGSAGRKKGKKAVKRDRVGVVDDDPWAVLKSKSGATPKGVFDVAQEPPKFGKLPREKFKVKEGARVNVDSIPNAAGSLRRREELGETRKMVIERYREMMRASR